jgi:hypothetical protein
MAAAPPPLTGRRKVTGCYFSFSRLPFFRNLPRFLQVHPGQTAGGRCIFRMTVFLAYKIMLIKSWKQLEKRSIKVRNTFTEASKEVKYEESCLCGSYSHNGHLSHKPIVQ